MTKRTLMALLAAALLVVILTACGGGGGGGASAVNISGRVALPPGSTVQLTTVTVQTGDGTFPVAADGSFKGKVTESGFWPISLVNANGQLLMLGFADTADSAKASITPATTAQALLALALGAETLPAANFATAISLMQQSPQFQALANTVTTRLAADPNALNDSDAQLIAAVQSAHDAMVPQARAANAMRNAPAATAVKMTLTRAAGTRGATPQLLIEPSTVQSGVEVLQNPGGSGIIVRNHFRRHCSFQLLETGFADSAGNTTTLPSAKPIAGFNDLPATQALSTFGALFDAATGAAPYTPVDSQPINVSLDATPGTVKTFFTVVVLGPTDLMVAPDPPIFSDSQFAVDVPDWQSQLEHLTLVNLVESFVFPILETAGMFGAGDLTANAANDFIGTNNAFTLTHALFSAQKIQDAQALLLNPNSLLSPESAQQVQAFLTKQLKEQGRQDAEIASRQVPAEMQSLANAGTILKVIQIAFKAFDLGAVLTELSQSSSAESWSITAVQPTVKLSPDAATVTLNNSVVGLSVSIVGQTDLSNFRFKWSCTDTMGGLQDSSGLNLHSVTNGLVSDSTVDYVGDSRIKQGQTDTVTVQAFQLPNTTTPFGTGTAVITGQVGSGGRLAILKTISDPSAGVAFTDGVLPPSTTGTAIDQPQLQLVSNSTSPIAKGGSITFQIQLPQTPDFPPIGKFFIVFPTITDTGGHGEQLIEQPFATITRAPSDLPETISFNPLPGALTGLQPGTYGLQIIAVDAQGDYSVGNTFTFSLN